ncbi:preprotein translocase subunit SecE [Deinococcus peraridilitoris]|uniref:Protein translocase subunit SecE n=1 Tax=Deinococcus peraridilitoris (strain DSM 19664 / LMG 22246 / CIP 109416 / KR-200) TaxID=937777 RepID=L0A0K7_DEIPD|nr:preprotein translocase subunit SecE [Deinococcus peraridilitoris]AFZ66540.1 preprotein translocase, SecE subunit [Deinococcus peraridilitoris DSM 19664]
MNGLLRYFQEARAELSRVTWPNRAQVLEGTQVVLVFIVVLTLFLFALDSVLAGLIRVVVPQ